LRVFEIVGTELGFRQYGADDQAKRHKGKAENQNAIADLIDSRQGRQARPESAEALGLEIFFLEQIKDAGDKTYDEGRVADHDESDVSNDPLGAKRRRFNRR